MVVWEPGGGKILARGERMRYKTSVGGGPTRNRYSPSKPARLQYFLDIDARVSPRGRLLF